MYKPADIRYEEMKYRKCNNSGLSLPVVSLGMWKNFGHENDYKTCRDIILKAFDSGINHFDTASIYGPPPRSSEELLGRVLNSDLKNHRKEIVVSTKAGTPAWAGPLGKGGSRKHIRDSLDESLRVLGLDYVDIYYHHFPDDKTPLEETAEGFAEAVKSGKALYVGISNYDNEQTKRISKLLKAKNIQCILHQQRYNMLQRKAEKNLIDTLKEENISLIAYSPIAGGVLTDKYLDGVPSDSRQAREKGLFKNYFFEENKDKIKQLNEMAKERGQSLVQMAAAWLLKDENTVSVITGASKPEQIIENAKAASNIDFTSDELDRIDKILGE